MVLREPGLRGGEVRTTLGSAMVVTLVEVRRGPLVESRHFGALVMADTTGRVLFARGDPHLVSYPRSALKPFQALALVALGGVARFGLTPAELAVICASHSGEPAHAQAVAGILRKAGVSAAELRCGVALPGRPTTAGMPASGGILAHQCSGKHAGMLALAELLGVPREGYLQPDHPVQRTIRHWIEQVLGAAAILAQGVDGCNAPAYALSLATMARAFALLAQPRGPAAAALQAIGDAMRAHPELVSASSGFLDTALMQAVPGLVAKRGAEGYFALGLADGRGLALKVLDGDGFGRAVGVATVAALVRGGVLEEAALPPSLAAFGPRLVLRDVTGQVIGSIQPARCLHHATRRALVR